ncbi:barstar family protein [Actinacidiphila glaucinigra]|uniref:barstar family protein n=1 Tax=Actinacidiphila glaucinigra TaxID=235986 RepID=UPI0032462C20
MTAAQRGYGCALTGDDDASDFWGYAYEARGLFAPLKGGYRQVTFLGCVPQGGLLNCLDQAGGRRALVGNAHLNLLDAEGTRMGGYFVGELAVTGSRPSTLHPGLVDVTVRLWCDDALPQSGRVWDLIRTGRLDRKGLWRSLGPAGRRAWLSVALFSRGYRPRGDAPAGQVFTLDGRHIMDEDSFYCALGEAVNGPGGYFGWNTAALDDCLTGRWGASTPFTLEWNSSELARSRLAKPYRGHGDGDTFFEAALEIFGDHGVEVVLR